MEDSKGVGELGGICTIRGLVARDGSRAGRIAGDSNPLASCLETTGGAGDRSSNERRLGGSVVGRPGAGLVFAVETGFAGGFSGLLGGVLKGEMWSSEVALSGRSGRGARVFESECENIAGLAGTFGFSARFAGGGKDALFSFRSAGLPKELAADSPGESRGIVSSAVTEDPSCGVAGRGPADTDSLGRWTEGRDMRLSS